MKPQSGGTAFAIDLPVFQSRCCDGLRLTTFRFENALI